MQITIRRVKRSKEYKLDLSRKDIALLPVQLFQLKHLLQLDLSHNQLSVLDNRIRQLCQLELLDVSENFITVLPQQLVELSNLRQLILIGNPLCEKYIIDTKVSLKTALQNVFGKKNSSESAQVVPKSLPPPTQSQSRFGRKVQRLSELSCRRKELGLSISNEPTLQLRLKGLSFLQLINRNEYRESWIGQFCFTRIFIKKYCFQVSEMADREISNCLMLRHPHFNSLMGVCSDETHIYIVYQYIENSIPLHLYLQRHFMSTNKRSLLKQLAQAFLYLTVFQLSYQNISHQHILVAQQKIILTGLKNLCVQRSEADWVIWAELVDRLRNEQVQERIKGQKNWSKMIGYL